MRKLSYLGERSEPRENARARGPPLSRLLSASTFHDIRKMDSLREHPVISGYQMESFLAGYKRTEFLAEARARHY